MQRVQALAYRLRRKNIFVSLPCCKPSFRSRTTSAHKPFSDLDLVVMGDQALPTDKAADLRQSFSDSDLTFKVDVVIWSELQDHFKRIIESGSVVIQSAPHK